MFAGPVNIMEIDARAIETLEILTNRMEAIELE
jgi:hypothetical protein